MSDLLEIVLEIVLEGALHGAASPRAPLVVRILLAAALAALWLGLSGLLLYVGMQSGSIPPDVPWGNPSGLRRNPAGG